MGFFGKLTVEKIAKMWYNIGTSFFGVKNGVALTYFIYLTGGMCYDEVDFCEHKRNRGRGLQNR